MATNNNPSTDICDQPIRHSQRLQEREQRENSNSAKIQTFQLSDEGSKYWIESSKHLNYNPENKIICRIIQLIKCLDYKSSTLSQNKDIQKCNFHYKTVRRFFTEIAGAHVLSKCPKERHSPPWNIKFSICFQGGDCLSFGHLLRTWRTEKSLTRN
jgi:hypothetical protein